ncbi:TolC family protein [Nitrospira moscoviensis]|uniref:Putative heavy metal efflux pump protein CzcC n=1 Tax=Nitrospira moscoviensis TaxID=42253 RepID=A0A0K2GAT3_NITMO|nr:TolC family protein [Nitrospira moscoviensis]ALA58055.1 putative heavy metal efflux pump protein CzcC [Nitrospira moscoviensis]
MKWIAQLSCVTTVTASVVFASVTFAEDQLALKTLDLSGVIAEALARNPEIQAARQQWEAASKRVTQARSLDDPNLSVQWWNAPESFNLGRAQNTIIGLAQKFPFPGKLALKEEIATRSAEMTEQALRARERDLTARVKQAYYDLFFAHKAIQIHHEQVDLLKQFLEIATAKFRTGKGTQVDVLKAQVELSTLYQRLPVLEQQRDTAQAKLNTLLDRDPRFPLGSPQGPHEGRFDKDLEELYQIATTARPELKAAELAVRRNEQSRALARRQYYPDFNVAVQRFQNFQANDGFGAVVSVNVPFAFWTKPRYDAAVHEAAAGIAAARADLHTLENLTRFQIRDLVARVRASWEVAVLYRTTVVPQAEQSVEAARAGYRTGRTSFLDLIEADRALRDFQLAYWRALVDRESRLAEVVQVVGTEL